MNQWGEHSPTLMASMLGDDNYRDIVAVLEALSRLTSRGTIGLELHDAFIEVLADDLVSQQVASDIASGLLPTAGQSADTARSEDACNESKSD